MVTKSADYREKDGYTLERLDIYGIGRDGLNKVIIRNVSALLLCTVRTVFKAKNLLIGICKSSILLHTFLIFKTALQCYVGQNDNPSFGMKNFYSVSSSQYYHPVGSEPLDILAYTIFDSVGPSGPNKVPPPFTQLADRPG